MNKKQNKSTSTKKNKTMNNKLLEKAVDCEPIGVIYSISSTKVKTLSIIF